MKNGTKDSYRQAYAEFVRAREYVGDYPNIDQMMQESRYLGISRAYVTVKNYSATKFPDEFEKELLALDLPGSTATGLNTTPPCPMMIPRLTT
jgi:hypothetical protein